MRMHRPLLAVASLLTLAACGHDPVAPSAAPARSVQDGPGFGGSGHLTGVGFGGSGHLVDPLSTTQVNDSTSAPETSRGTGFGGSGA